ncbi:MAG: Mov34/MPN/PAD-1 family protein [Planctomycetes bacterium]|nr:Mov34/MPN/PAD-1 family protein [Planctomycetota bacterium]
MSRDPTFFPFVEFELVSRSIAASPIEACGLVLAPPCAVWPDDASTYRASQTRNASPSPMRAFWIDPLEWIAQEDAAQTIGLAVHGFWHSHPRGSFRPSIADLQMRERLGDGAPDWLFAIVGRDDCGAWQLAVHENENLRRHGRRALLG